MVNMNKYIKTLTLTAFIVSVSAAFYLTKPASKVSDDFAPRQEVYSRWIKELNKSNSQLHDAILAAMLASKVSGKEVFILHNNVQHAKLRYNLSYQRGGAENILSYNFNENYFSFDHYSTNEGISLPSAENMIIIDRKLQKFYKELSIK